ncbi:MAG TPA: GntR family transcriptional regulator [Chloroflexota bacterium]
MSVLAAPPHSVVAQLRQAIVRGDLSPGEQIRQAEWAERLGVSRVPIREALEALAAEGLLNHDQNRGYFVTRFGAREVAQIYLMRRLLETELLVSLDWPDAEQLASLERIGRAASAHMLAGDFEQWNELEHRFHQELYALSPLNLVRAEADRLWVLSNVYRVVGFGHADAQHLGYAATYYQRILDALGAHDRSALVHHLREIRERTERRYAAKLQQGLRER